MRFCQLNLLKGSLHRYRRPVIKLDESRISQVETCKYLGIILDEKLKFKNHIQDIGTRAFNKFSKIRRVGRQDWGINFKNKKLIYLAVFEGIVLYGCPIWASVLEYSVYAKLLNKFQRMALITVNASYRTVSHDALCVIAGLLPLDIKAKLRMREWMLKKERNLSSTAKRVLLAQAYTEWQSRWDTIEKGRHTYRIFPDVFERTTYSWLVPDYGITQVLSGHGKYHAYFERFGLSQNGNCIACGVLDDVDHAVYTCSDHHLERRILIRELERIGANLDLKQNVKYEDQWKLVVVFIKKIMASRQLLVPR
jgi:hypothetical protein